MRTAEIFVARGYRTVDPRRTPGDAAVWLVALSRGTPPAGWESHVEWLLAHPVPYVRVLALNHLPPSMESRFIPAIRENLAAADIDVRIAACGAVMRGRLAALRAQVREMLETETDRQLVNAASNALFATDGRFERLDILAKRLAEPGMPHEWLGRLVAIFETTASSSSGPGPSGADHADATSPTKSQRSAPSR
jgi:hypothetical protein